MFNFHFLPGSVNEFSGDKHLIIVSLPSVFCFLESAKWSKHVTSRNHGTFFSKEERGAWKRSRPFPVVCIVTWPLYESEAWIDLILIKASPLFLCKFLLLRMRTTSLTQEKQGRLNNNEVNFSLSAVLRAHRRIFRALLRKWNVTSGNWRHHIMSWQENPLTSKSHRTNCCFYRRFFLALPRARSQINCACVNELTSGLRKKLNFRQF